MRRFLAIPLLLLSAHVAPARAQHAVPASPQDAVPALAQDAVPARAQATVTTPHGTVSLLAATTGARAGTPLALALRLALPPGWHTYWSNPGDAGMPPVITASVDGGAAAPVALGFPAPRRIDEGGLVGFGYEGVVAFPFHVTPAAGTGPFRLAVQASFLVCATVCVPEDAALSLVLPRVAGVPATSGDAAAIAAAVRALPRALPMTATVSPDGRLRVDGPGIGRATVARAMFFPDTPGLIDADAVQTLSVDGGGLTLGLHPASGFAAAPELAGVLALVDPSGGETDLAVTARKGLAPAARGEHAPAAREGPSPEAGQGFSPAAGQELTAAGRPDVAGHSRSLLALVLLALAGGVVLNAMPCVFPVLAMKALALARAASAADARARRRSALLYAAGAVGSLVGFGVVLLVLRAGGSGVAWGFQLQSAPVVGLTALLLFAVGLNLLGAFEIGTGGLAGAGQGLVARGGAAGDVLAGGLAVLVATPCTAPFMGAALAGALAGPPATALAVFASLGLGLASPMLLLGLVPGAARLFPRPGAWMETLRQLLAWPMFAAVLWLVWVVSVEAGPAGVLRVGGALILLGFALSVPRLFAGRRFAGRRVGVASGAIVAVLAFALLTTIRAGGGGSDASSSALPGAEPFSATRLAALTASGRPVLVDMSAAWCLTCLVNERVALVPAREALARRGVVLMRGDWTRQDPAITSFLRRFAREGVPLVVFFPADGAPRVLPQILTAGDIRDAIAS